MVAPFEVRKFEGGAVRPLSFVETGRLFAVGITITLPLVVQAAPVRLKVVMPEIPSADSLGKLGRT
jgi:hypothetical protein